MRMVLGLLAGLVIGLLINLLWDGPGPLGQILLTAQFWGPLLAALIAVAGVIATIRTTDKRADKDRAAAEERADKDRAAAEERADKDRAAAAAARLFDVRRATYGDALTELARYEDNFHTMPSPGLSDESQRLYELAHAVALVAETDDLQRVLNLALLADDEPKHKERSIQELEAARIAFTWLARCELGLPAEVKKLQEDLEVISYRGVLVPYQRYLHPEEYAQARRDGWSGWEISDRGIYKVDEYDLDDPSS